MATLERIQSNKENPLSEEAAILRSMKLHSMRVFSKFYERVVQILLNTALYALILIAGHGINELAGFLNQGTLEKFSELRYIGTMVEYGLYIFASIGAIVHNAFDLLIQIRMDYNEYKGRD